MMMHPDEVIRAAQAVALYLSKTPLLPYREMSENLGLSVFTKMEYLQLSGSFKARGVFCKMLSIPPKVRQRTFFVAASTGNHAVAFCTALKMLNLAGKVYLPTHVASSKLDLIKTFDTEYGLVGSNSLQTEKHARSVAQKAGHTLIHPYNDRLIIAGQGTIALELLDQMQDLDVVVVPVGGGGLISGIASYFKSRRPRVHIVGCQPLKSPEMVFSIRKGEIITDEISQCTLSDGTAGGIEPGSITYDLCAELVDEWALIGEEEISHEIRQMCQSRDVVIEGAAALPLAYIRKNSHKLRGKKVVAVLTGKRISREKLARILGE